MSDDGILKAEQRVREMNRMAQQYSEQGNRYLQNMKNPQNNRQTRFEPVRGQTGQGVHGSRAPERQDKQRQNSSSRSDLRRNEEPPQESPRQESITQEKAKKTPAEKEGYSQMIGIAGPSADSDGLLILIMIYLLMKEKADIKLILALAYLLM